MADEAGLLGDSELSAMELADTLSVSAYTFSRVIRTGLRDAVVQGRTLESVLQRAALSISSAALTASLRPLTTILGHGASALFSGIGTGVSGALSSALKAVPFAEGGVIGSPVGFPMPGGRVGLMGEAGREAVLPLSRGTDGRLGVALEGRGAAQSVVVNIATPDVEGFRRSEAQLTATLARAVARGRRGL